MPVVFIGVDVRDIADIDAGIDQLLALRDRLIGSENGRGAASALSVSPPSTRHEAANSGNAAEEAMDDLWPRLGRRIRELVRAAASFEQPYATRELAERLAKDLATTRSWRMNLGRSLNAVARNHPDAPPFFQDHAQPGGGWRHSVHPAYRGLVARRDVAEPGPDGTPAKP